jgi:hypothetical protein
MWLDLLPAELEDCSEEDLHERIEWGRMELCKSCRCMRLDDLGRHWRVTGLEHARLN